MTRFAPLLALLLFATAPASAAPALTAEAVNAASGDAPGALLRAQVLLERARFSPGQIDGGAGDNTSRAIAGFQRARGLEPTGQLDQPTWQALERDAAPALVTYTLVEADVAGPFRKTPDDMMAQAKLDALGFASVEEAVGEKFHVSPKLLARLNPGKALKAGTDIVVPNVAALPALAPAATVVVDRSDSVVRLQDADGRTYAQFPASTGSEHDPLPIGTWEIKGVAAAPTFHYDPALFHDADDSHAKATLAPGPNNPVGAVWIDLSKEHYGIHGTPDPEKIGKTQSNGCIRLTNWSARAVADAVKPGTPALLQE
ncbi:MAG TPA: L,D-transpeptidase [Luteimonas sp.]|nr:L,D-transpeptidase [Luteimonas sp.]